MTAEVCRESKAFGAVPIDTPTTKANRIQHEGPEEVLFGVHDAIEGGGNKFWPTLRSGKLPATLTEAWSEEYLREEERQGRGGSFCESVLAIEEA